MNLLIRQLSHLIVFLVFSLSLNAQILKVDKASIDTSLSNLLVGSLNFDFDLNNRSATAEQSITYFGVDFDADLMYLTDSNAYILINKLNYFKTTTGPLFSSGYAHFRVNLLRKRKLSYELFSQIQYDQGRNMPYRNLEGGGIRVKVFKTEKSNLYFGIGAMYELEGWKSINVERGDQIIEKHIIKSTNYINFKQEISKHAHINIIAYYQVGYDNSSEIYRNRFNGEAVLDVDITDKLSLNVSYAAQYEDLPIIPIHSYVYSLTNGLKYSF